MKALFTVPHDAVTVEYGLAGPVWLEQTGIIITINNCGMQHTLENAKEQMAAFDKVYKGIPRPLIVDFTLVRSMQREARAYYSSDDNSLKIKALAIVTGSNIGRLVGNFFIGLNSSDIPTKIFSNGEEAKKWAIQFV